MPLKFKIKYFKKDYVICLRVPPELLLPACSPLYAGWFSTLQANPCLSGTRKPGAGGWSNCPAGAEGARGHHWADKLHNMCMCLHRSVHKVLRYYTVKNVRNMTSASGGGYEMYLMGRLFRNVPPKALSTHTRVPEVPALTNVGLGQQLICLSMALGFNIDVKYLDAEPHWNDHILCTHYCMSGTPSPPI